MKTVLYFFAAFSAVGLVLSLASHAAALMGTSGPLGDHVWELHIGIFVVWIPAVFASTRLTRNVPRKDAWKAALRGCPDWMKYMTYGFFGYALLNFASLFITAPHGMPAVQGGGPGLMPPQIVRGFSAHWMAFYSAALALLWSAGCGIATGSAVARTGTLSDRRRNSAINADSPFWNPGARRRLVVMSELPAGGWHRPFRPAPARAGAGAAVRPRGPFGRSPRW